MSNSRPVHEQRAIELIAAGKKIEAIKVLREATGMGLAEAKQAVDQLESTGQAPAKSIASPTELPVEVVDLAKQGKTVEAIKRLRERSNLSLHDAKELVDRVPVDPGVRKAGCAGLVLLGIGLSGALMVF
jgi:ribosomal protein L7/L12